MIEKITCSDIMKDGKLLPFPIVAKLNEVIDVVNATATLIHHHEVGDELALAAKKAAVTGSHADLKAYLALRRKYL